MRAEDLVIFILSHKSPNNCESLETIKRLNYKGKWYIIIDNEDDIDSYKAIYKDHLIIYDKSKYKYTTDLGYSIKNIPSFSHAVFARNAAEDIAKDLKLDHYIIADDDIYDIHLRVVIDDKLPITHINDINEPLCLYYEYMMSNNLTCVGLGTPNFYMSGAEGIKTGAPFRRRCVSNFYMRNMNIPVKWVGPIDDFTTSITNDKRGNTFLTLYPLAISVRPQYTQKGAKSNSGEVEFYKNSNSFQRSYVAYIMAPSFVTVKYYNGNYLPYIKNDYAYPKIISDKYKSK